MNGIRVRHPQSESEAGEVKAAGSGAGRWRAEKASPVQSSQHGRNTCDTVLRLARQGSKSTNGMSPLRVNSLGARRVRILVRIVSVAGYSKPMSMLDGARNRAVCLYAPATASTVCGGVGATEFVGCTGRNGGISDIQRKAHPVTVCVCVCVCMLCE